MSSTLSNGYKLPADGDTGATFWDDLEANISRVNGHTHRGSDSEKLITVQAISSASWGSPTNGIYSQTITLSSSLNYDDVNITFRVGSGSDDGDIIHLRCDKASATSYTVYINDNSIDVDAIYT